MGCGIPVAVVDDLAQDELVARSVGGLVIDLLMIEKSGVLILGQAIGHDVRAQPQRIVLGVENSAFDRVGIGVPAAG